MRELVEPFANLADTKDVDPKMTLFTEDAVLEGYATGKPTGRNFVGKEAIGNAFKGYLSLFHTVYHLNGQHTSHIEGNRATATTYCYVTLVREVEGKEEKTVHYAIYNDEFVKRNGKWLIAKRKSNFVRTEVSSEKWEARSQGAAVLD